MKPAGYWRGTGQTEKFPNSEQFSLLYYPKCQEGFHAWGCCNCKFACPEGMKDLTSMCKKTTYQRGDAVPPTCANKEDQLDHITQKCYPKCDKPTDIASGSFCWSECPTGTTPCGGGLCMEEGQECKPEMMTDIKKSIDKLKE